MTQGRFANQTAIVTGAARGIGLGIARRLASEGARVIAWDINFDQAGSKDPEGIVIESRIVDVTDSGAIQAGIDDVISRFGRLDIFVNNAGVTGTQATVQDYQLEEWNRVLTLDLTAVFLCCRACIPPMRDQGYGRIVNIASIAGKQPTPGIAAYSAAKSGVIGFTRSMARELAGSGVLANCVAPAMAATELIDALSPTFVEESRKKIPLGRFVTVEEIASVAAFAASPECSFTTGFTFDASGGRADF